MSLSNRPCKSVSSWCCKKLRLFADVCTNPQADDGGVILVNVYMDSVIGTFGATQVNVETSVSVFLTVSGDSTAPVTGMVTIPAGQSYGYDYYPDFVPFENVVGISIDLISPTGSTTQTYSEGYTTFTGSCSIPPTPSLTPTNTPTNTTTPTPTLTPGLSPSETPTNTPTPTITPTQTCDYYLTIAATYNNVYEMVISVDIVGGAPSYDFDLSFDWCTDSGASGSTTFYANAGYTTLTGTNINLSTYGDQGVSGFSWGDNAVFVGTTSTSPVTQMYVKGSTLTFTSSDPSCNYYISYENVDNSCSSPAPVVDQCFHGSCL